MMDTGRLSNSVRLLLAASLLASLFLVARSASPTPVDAANYCNIDNVNTPYKLYNPNRFAVYADGDCSSNVYYLHVRIDIYAGIIKLGGGAYACSNCSLEGGVVTDACSIPSSGNIQGRAQISYKRFSSSSLVTGPWVGGPVKYLECG